jgi:hypothetical protein
MQNNRIEFHHKNTVYQKGNPVADARQNRIYFFIHQQGNTRDYHFSSYWRRHLMHTSLTKRRGFTFAVNDFVPCQYSIFTLIHCCNRKVHFPGCMEVGLFHSELWGIFPRNFPPEADDCTSATSPTWVPLTFPMHICTRSLKRLTSQGLNSMFPAKHMLPQPTHLWHQL